MYLIIYLIGLIYFCKYMFILYLKPGATNEWETCSKRTCLKKTSSKRSVLHKQEWSKVHHSVKHRIIQVHLLKQKRKIEREIECQGKIQFFSNCIQKVKRSYLLDSLHKVKCFKPVYCFNFDDNSLQLTKIQNPVSLNIRILHKTTQKRFIIHK